MAELQMKASATTNPGNRKRRLFRHPGRINSTLGAVAGPAEASRNQPDARGRFNATAAGPLYGELAHEAGLVNGDLGIAAESLAVRVSELMQQYHEIHLEQVFLKIIGYQPQP